MFVIEENAFSILERRLNRIEGLILNINSGSAATLSPNSCKGRKKSPLVKTSSNASIKTDKQEVSNA